MRDWRAGYSLIELTVAMAIFSVFLLMLVALDREWLRYDRRLRLTYLTHPEEMALLARFRSDVLDTLDYPAEYLTFSQSPKTLILRKMNDDRVLETVVYDFRENSIARRMVYIAGEEPMEWMARGLPLYRVSSYPVGSKTAVRLMARNSEGRLLVDQIIQPRAGS